jgi:cytochrome c556
MWEKGSKVGEITKAWKAAVVDRAASAGDGLDKLKPKVAAISKECSSCHKAHRAKDF